MLKFREFLLVIGLVAVVASCSSPEEAEPAVSVVPPTSISSPTTAATTPDTAPPTVPATTMPATTVPASTTPATTAPPTTAPGGGGDCAVGVWKLRSQEFLDQLTDAVEGVPAGTAIEHTGGNYFVEIFPDGTMNDIRNDWQWTMSTELGQVRLTINSYNPGTWVMTPDTPGDGSTGEIAFESVGAPADVTIEVFYNGQWISPPTGSGPRTVDSDAISGTGRFTCIPGAVLQTTHQGITSTLDYVGSPATE